MKIAIYGPNKDDPGIAELLKHVPPDTLEVKITAPLRNAIDRRACQHPNWLFLDASCDDKVFIHLVQVSPTAPYIVSVT